jgi:hypothetical protein
MQLKCLTVTATVSTEINQLTDQLCVKPPHVLTPHPKEQIIKKRRISRIIESENDVQKRSLEVSLR